ncbi:hypothetical protein FNT36_10405 [Hymenobacter setariae]|uniref:MoxR-vWA-beta-propeller ternary system domain-containing protein n=1 Tax=Hymenobacter setariae TaxID=2594794 RepID=A0A558BZ66_9BACT|nr:hypothetical protein [Hymenobacter setariae]TVT41825.1 hypothetical protein FNT36_10405 [Hymenobacter setariae]
MLLTSFLQDLLATGSITVSGQPVPFETADLEATEKLLREYYAEDRLDLPHAAPAFEAAAALWAVQYLYYTAVLAVVRELDEAAIARHLPEFEGEVTPAASYSADLSLRYLPDLLQLAKGLAPADTLVVRLRHTARQWPLSFVGHEPADDATEATLLAHPALRGAYVDRIIGAQDRQRASQPHLAPLVQAALGAYSAQLWPDFHTFTLLA